MLVMGLAVAVSISEYVRLNKSSRSQTPLIMDGAWLIETCATDRLNAKSRTEADAAKEDIQRLDTTGNSHGPDTKAERSDVRTFADLCVEWSRVTWPGITPATRGA